MAMTGKNRIMIYGPKADGTYVVEFRTAVGAVLAISIPRSEAAVIQHFQERMPYGLFVPDDGLHELGRSAWPDKGRRGGLWASFLNHQRATVMEELRECIRKLKSIQERNTSMRDVVLPIIDALAAIDERIVALERASPRNSRESIST